MILRRTKVQLAFFALIAVLGILYTGGRYAGLGKLVPHPTYPAQTNDRYLEQPILSLRDVGTYAQILGGQGIVDGRNRIPRQALFQCGRTSP